MIYHFNFKIDAIDEVIKVFSLPAPEATEIVLECLNKQLIKVKYPVTQGLYQQLDATQNYRTYSMSSLSLKDVEEAINDFYKEK